MLLITKGMVNMHIHISICKKCWALLVKSFVQKYYKVLIFFLMFLLNTGPKISIFKSIKVDVESLFKLF